MRQSIRTIVSLYSTGIRYYQVSTLVLTGTLGGFSDCTACSAAIENDRNFSTQNQCTGSRWSERVPLVFLSEFSGLNDHAKTGVPRHAGGYRAVAALAIVGPSGYFHLGHTAFERWIVQ